MKHDLFADHELAPGTMRAIRVENIAIVVIRDAEGSLSALRDICPHHGAALSQGVLQQKVIGDQVGSKDLSAELIVRCPRHGYEFDVGTGRCPADERQRVRVYAVDVENGRVVLER